MYLFLRKELVNCAFARNSSDITGGAIGGPGGAILVNSTFVANRAGLAGGGISRAAVDIANCVFWGNQDAGGTDESAQIHLPSTFTPQVSHSCIQGGWSPASGTANIGEDPVADNPRFVLTPSLGSDGLAGTDDDIVGDQRLLPSSPCIDAGDNTAVPADVFDLDGDGDVGEPLPFDLAGVPRFQDDPDTPDTGNGTPPIVDMGAYEGPTLPALLRIVGGSDVVDDSSTLIWPKAEDVGLDTFEIEVDQAVSLVGSSVVTSGGASTPAVSALTHVGAGVHRVDLTEPISVGHWTIITLTVAGATGGESTFELCLGHLPDDINGDGTVDMSDATEFGLLFRSDPGDPDRERIDLNGDGQANLNDVTLFGQLWRGTSGHDAWQGQSLPPRP